MKCTPRRCLKASLLLIVLYCGLSYYHFYYNRYVVKYRHSPFDDVNINASCNLPELNPFDPSIRKYVFHQAPLVCSSNHEYTYIDENGLLRINATAVKLSGQTLTRCEYAVVLRPNDGINNDIKIIYGKPIQFHDGTNVYRDFFKVMCYNDREKMIYSNVHGHVSPITDKVKPKLDRKKNPNVIIIGIDSMSRMNFIRKMQSTYGYLTSDLKAFVYKGFNSVGDVTMSNLYPMLLGLTDWYVDGSKHFFDPMPLIWKNFSAKGYMTMFSEDEPSYGVFHYLTKGFKVPPTDHYQRPYYLSLDDIDVVNSLLSPVWQLAENTGVKIGKTSVYCFGRKPKHVLQMDYLRHFIKQYSDTPAFAFSWNNQLAHEYLNSVEIADDDYTNLLKDLKNTGALDNTFLILMSDHGNRFDWIRHTQIGRVEERMPILAIVPPKNFDKTHPGAYKSLQINTQRLLTTYDLHEVLKDILNDDYTDRNIPNNGKISRGLSLFGTIPKSRSCYQASIKEHYCACYGSKTIDTKSHLITKYANFIVNTINKITDNERRKCSLLKVKLVKTAYKVTSGSLNEWDSYIIVIETTPGNALFEATVNDRKNGTLLLGGDISRINKYGNQSICTNQKLLRKYCYCLNSGH